jgi:diguanylate cyclase (GGDEF)-like protein
VRFEKRVGLGYFIVFLLAFSIATTVFLKGNHVESVTTEYLTKQLPTLNNLKAIKYLVIQRERRAYEFYATTDIEGLRFEFQKITTEWNPALEQIQPYISPELKDAIHSYLIAEPLIIESLVTNIQSNQIDWDLAREQLQAYTEQRLTLSEVLDHAIETQNSVSNESADKTLNDINWITVIVLSFSVGAMIAGAILAYFINRAILDIKERKRLSMFAHRNPNPLITIDFSGNVTYANPACDVLLSKIRRSGQPKSILFTLDVESFVKQLHLETDTTVNFQYSIAERVFSLDIYRLSDLHLFHIYIEDVTEAIRAEQKLIYMANHDRLTQLPNRHEFESKMDQIVQNDSRVLVSLISIDRFSRVTSSIGYNIGDALIANTAQVLLGGLAKRSRMLPKTKLYRFSGTTFALYMILKSKEKSFDPDEIVTIIEDMVTEEFKYPLSVSDNNFYLTNSVGISFFPEHGDNTVNLIKNAEAALNKAQGNGGAQTKVYNNALEHHEQSWFNLETELRGALKREELILFYQPQIGLASEKVEGLEALVRWYKNGALVSPGQFIPIAEQTGLIVTIGEWIFRQACTQAIQWQQSGNRLLVAVNISPRQFQHRDFVAMIEQVVYDTQIDPSTIELEITEGVVIDNVERSIEIMTRLKSMGFILSMDDFGTGYSSLSYLKRFPIDKLKIDMSFIRNLNTSEQDKSIVKTIIELAHNLSLSVIAEGVEDQSQLDTLKGMGCETIQGYLKCKPLAPFDLKKNHFVS